MGEQPIRPGTWLYGVATILAVAGVAVVVVGVVFLVGRVTGIGSDFQRVVVPGSGTITLGEPGKYTIYHEYMSTLGGRVYSSPQGLAGLSFRLAPMAPTDTPRSSMFRAAVSPRRNELRQRRPSSGGTSFDSSWSWSSDKPALRRRTQSTLRLSTRNLRNRVLQ